MDQSTVLIVAAVALLAVIGYLVVMRVFYRDSEALDAKIDLTKMEKWKDED
jgi:low affinity Fe/Cu permease